MAEKQLKGGSLSEGCAVANKARTGKANNNRMTPPPGPKAEPVKLNGVPLVGGKGIK